MSPVFPGSESLEVKLFRPEEISWQEIAIRSIHDVLRLYCADRETGRYSVQLLDIA